MKTAGQITRRSMLGFVAAGLVAMPLPSAGGAAQARPRLAGWRERRRERQTGLRDLDAGARSGSRIQGDAPATCRDQDRADRAPGVRCPGQPQRR